MKRPWILVIPAILGLSLLWYWFTPHESTLVRQAEKGDVQAMYEVGMAHLSTSGYGVIDPRSPRDPALWLRRAAEKGHIGAMWELAGIGIPNDEKVMWLKKGAELGSSACMIELSNSYFHQMHGLPKDLGAYLYWEAQASESMMKLNGETPQNIASRRGKGEIRRRRDLNYDGPIRPLP